MREKTLRWIFFLGLCWLWLVAATGVGIVTWLFVDKGDWQAGVISFLGISALIMSIFDIKTLYRQIHQ